MSDEHEIIRSAIRELEQKQKEGWENIKKLFYTLLGDTEKSLKEKIEALEKRIDEEELFTTRKLDKEGTITKEIAELTARVDQHMKNQTRYRKQITELKEVVNKQALVGNKISTVEDAIETAENIIKEIKDGEKVERSSKVSVTANVSMQEEGLPPKSGDDSKPSKKHKYIYHDWKGFITPIPKSQAQREDDRVSVKREDLKKVDDVFNDNECSLQTLYNVWVEFVKSKYLKEEHDEEETC